MFDKDATPYKASYYIKGDGTEVSLAEYTLYQINVKPDTAYTITNSGASTAPGYVVYNSSGTRVAGENYANKATVTFTTPSTAAYIRFSVVTKTSSSRYDKERFQLEENSTATPYEPYYLATTTKVTTAKDHTIKAIWQANSYTVTANANGGTIPATTGWTGTGSNATKSVTYDAEYGALPVPTRTGYTFKGWSLLPDGYEQVEYIDFNGSQYIDTGILTKQSLKIESEFSTTSATRLVFGGRTSTSADAIIFGCFSNNASYVGFGGATTNYSTTINPIDGNKHKVILSKDIYQLDGTNQTIKNRSTLTKFNNIYLGTWNNNGSADSRRYIGKIYNFIVYDESEIVRFMIPCINKSTGKAGFYDLVSGTFYGKEAGDDFTYGNKTYVTAQTIVTQTQNHTLNAIWEANPYKVKFNSNGGTGTMADQSFTYNEEKALTANSFTKSGYVFAGWNTKADLTGTLYKDKQSVKNLTSAKDGVFNLYARWIKFTLSTDKISLKTGQTTTISPSGTTGAKVTYTVEPTVELEFSSENTSVATVNASTGAVTTKGTATSGASTKIIIKDKLTGTKFGELTVTIDTQIPVWTVKLLDISNKT